MRLQNPTDFIERTKKTIGIPLRIDPELKKLAEKEADKQDTSLNRFIEAAIRFYLERLSK